MQLSGLFTFTVLYVNANLKSQKEVFLTVSTCYVVGAMNFKSVFYIAIKRCTYYTMWGAKIDKKKSHFPFIFYFFVTEVFFNYALLHSLKILSLAAVFAIFVQGCGPQITASSLSLIPKSSVNRIRQVFPPSNSCRFLNSDFTESL